MRRAAYAGILAVASGLPGLIAAQEGPDLALPGGGTRPFADPVFWLNSGPSDRLPITERALVRRPGFAGAAPPRARRDGLTPSLSFAGVSLTSDQDTQPDESFAALGVGIEYAQTERRWQLLTDYYAEFTNREASDDALGTHGGFVSFSYDLSPRDRVGAALFRTSTENLEDATAERLAGDVTRSDSTDLVLSYRRLFDPRSGVVLSFADSLQETDGIGGGDLSIRSLSARGWYFLHPARRIDATLRFRSYDLDGAREESVDAQIGLTADLGNNMAASLYFDLLATSADGGQQFATLGGTFSAGWTNARLDIGVVRDVTAVPGLDQLLLSDEATARLRWRLDHGLLADITAEQQTLETIGGGAPTRVVALEGQLSYAVSRDLWLWGRLRTSRESVDDLSKEDTNVTIGLSRRLEF